MIKLITILSLIFVVNNACCQINPATVNPVGWVNDFAHILTKPEIKTLDSIINKFEEETTVEIAIVTFDTTYTITGSFDSLVTNLGRAWGIGKEETNNGIIIGVSTALRIIRISNGYGIETKISDAETKAIIDNMITPSFAKANFFEGLKKGLEAIMKKLR